MGTEALGPLVDQVREIARLQTVYSEKLARTNALVTEWAEAKGVRYVAKPQMGDLFALYFPTLNRYAHVGIVASVNPDGSILTYEGNTSGAGEREGWMVASKTRKLGRRDRLIRWVELL